MGDISSGWCAYECRSRGGCGQVWHTWARLGKSGWARLIKSGWMIYLVGGCAYECRSRGECG